VIAAAGIWAYAPSFSGVLLLDDFDSIAGNPSIKSLRPLARVLSPPAFATVSGRPVANLTFAVNYALAPADVRDDFETASPPAAPEAAARAARNLWGYHAANLVIHLLAALALFGIVRRTLAADPLQARVGTLATPLALATSLVWLVHPLQTESVTYLVQRVESLMGLFYLLTLYCAIRAWDSSRPGAWSVAAIAACALGMGTKEVMVTAPLMVWLWDWSFGESQIAPAPSAALLRPRRWPLYVGLASTWIVLATLVAGNPRGSTVGFGVEGWTPLTYLLTETGVLVHYLRLAVVPSPLIFDYFWQRADSLWKVLPAAVLLAAFVAATVFGVARRHPLAFASAWFLLILAPTSSVLPIVTEIAAEHRMYLPLAGVVAAVLVGGASLVRGRLAAERGPARWVALGVVVILVLGLGTLTRARNRDYSSERRLWADTMTKQPDNPRARMSYGVDLLAAGRAAEAEPYLESAVNLDGQDARALMNLGAAQFALGKLDPAIANLERALALRPEFSGARRNLAEAYAARHDDARAVSNFEEVLKALPDDVAAAHRLAWILATSKDGAVRDSRRAVSLAERAVELTARRNAMYLNTLAASYAGAGRIQDAIGAMREAVTVARAQGRENEAAGLERQLARLEEDARRSARGPR
jgi:tetratricopeptide (TPR) repeat protein